MNDGWLLGMADGELLGPNDGAKDSVGDIEGSKDRVG